MSGERDTVIPGMDNVSSIVADDEMTQQQRTEETDMANGEGFTSQDRKSLTTLEVELTHVRQIIQEMSTRLVKVEEAKVSARDLEQVYTEVDELRVKKAAIDQIDIEKKRVDDHEVRLRRVEQRIWMYIGGGTVAITIIEALLRLGAKG